MSTNHRPIRAHLRSLIPSNRHAFFRAKVIIHELINVPLVEGEFALKWRFQRAQSIHPDHFPPSNDKTRDNEQLSSVGTIEDNSSEQDSPTESTRASSGSSGPSPPQKKPLKKSRYGNTASYGQYLAPSSAPTPSTSSHSEDNLEIPDTSTTDPRGLTKFCPIFRDHTVAFNHRIEVDLDIIVDKDTTDLHPSELKVSVLQEAEEGDSDSSSSFGGIVINLSEYANSGKITRHHLLQGSKANAVLRITIQMRHTGGESQFVAPPLPATQIMSGVSGLLMRDGLLPGALNVEAFRSHNSLASHNSSRPGSATPDRPVLTSRNSNLPLPSRAPSPVESSSTEAVIDALFNPYVSPSSFSAPSPFTIPYQARLSKNNDGPLEVNPTPTPTPSRKSTSTESDYSTATASSGSVRSELTKSRTFLFKRVHTSSSGAKWWRIGGSPSRPSSPGAMSAPSQQTVHSRAEGSSGGSRVLPMSPIVAKEDLLRMLKEKNTIKPPKTGKSSALALDSRNEGGTPAIAITDADSMGMR